MANFVESSAALALVDGGARRGLAPERSSRSTDTERVAQSPADRSLLLAGDRRDVCIPRPRGAIRGPRLERLEPTAGSRGGTEGWNGESLPGPGRWFHRGSGAEDSIRTRDPHLGKAIPHVPACPSLSQLIRSRRPGRGSRTGQDGPERLRMGRLSPKLSPDTVPGSSSGPQPRRRMASAIRSSRSYCSARIRTERRLLSSRSAS
jgi:hypothetical protein